jgi:translation elongation factor EF-4
MKAMVRASPSHDHTQLIVQVYAGVFPVDSGDFSKLEEAIERVSFGSSMTLL